MQQQRQATLDLKSFVQNHRTDFTDSITHPRRQPRGLDVNHRIDITTHHTEPPLQPTQQSAEVRHQLFGRLLSLPGNAPDEQSSPLTKDFAAGQGRLNAKSPAHPQFDVPQRFT
jgi:hypothetical protein